MSYTAYLVCLLLFVLTGILVTRWKRSNIPGPIGLPFFGLSIHYMNISTTEIFPTMKALIERYGGIFQVELFGMTYVLLSEPETAEPLLSSTTNITKGYREYSLMRPWLNTGLLTSDIEKWRVRRKLLTPSFHLKILESSLEAVYRNAQSLAAALLATGGKTIEINEMVRLSALKIICETAMGVKLNIEDKQQSEYIKAVNDATNGLMNRFLKFWLFPDFIFRNSKPGKSFFKSTNILHKFALQIISEKKKLLQSEKTALQNEKTMEKEPRKAFLDTLLELEYSNPGLFSEDDIREEVDTFIFAGYDAGSKALMFLHFLFANHPNVQEKAYKELKEIFGDDQRMPTKQDLQKMIYLEMVIKETLRLYPSVPLISRTLTEDLKIDDKIIRAGQTAVVSPHFIHRSKKHWTDPEEFIPERFTPGIERHPFSFIPFSAGPRNCLGQKFAMMESKTLLSTILRQCRLEPVTTSVVLEVAVVMKPVDPIKIKVFPRDQKAN